MSIERLLVTDKEALRHKCKEVERPDEAQEIIHLLYDELRGSSSGVGLSAPQMGIDKKVFVILVDGQMFSFVNPEILHLKRPYVATEGCLSFPGVTVQTVRYNYVYFRDSGYPGQVKLLEGFSAHVFQHEYDHLEGILMFDRVVPGRYDECFCGSGEKFKFCCYSKV